MGLHEKSRQPCRLQDAIVDISLDFGPMQYIRHRMFLRGTRAQASRKDIFQMPKGFAFFAPGYPGNSESLGAKALTDALEQG